MESLLPIPDDPAARQPTADASCAVTVAVASGVWRTFTYLWPAELGQPEIGQRVHVPFGKGNRKTLAFVVQALGTRDQGPEQQVQLPGARSQLPGLKFVAGLVDPHSQFDVPLWKLGQWISQYYLTPLGMVLAAMVPSAVGRHADRTQSVAFLAKERHDWPIRLGLRQKTILDELYEARKQGVEPLALEELLRHSQGGRDTIRTLVQRGLIRQESRPVVLPELTDASAGDTFDLNDAQVLALKAIEGKLSGGFSVTLLHGVTGSGKTEVYVRAIRQVIAAGKQAILLAPEIALATQTLQRLISRLPRVAVLHSALTGVQRAFYYQQIRDGHAAVVVGPRSAIFAPCRNLGLIIVDEEHEPTYKQDSVPRYHARDTAVMRGNLSGVPVVLGSATPSLESLANARAGKYELVSLPHRVRGLPMPELQIVNLRQEIEPGRVELIGKTLTNRMASVLDQRGQIILLMNRRGYASYVFCPSCRWIMSCDHCSRAMVYHQATRLAMCHYCEHTMHLPEFCPACKKKLLLFGFGIQRIEGELARKFPQATLARMDSDTMTTPRQFQKVFDEFGSGKIDILLGTQMVAKGLDFPGVMLVGVVSADTSLTIPDFRAAERTFQLIVQVAGRAGRAEGNGQVIVQTLHAEEPAIALAAKHDYQGFADAELPLRKEIGYPPYARMVRLIARDEKQDRAQQAAAMMAETLKSLLPAGQYHLVGPQPCGVAKVRNQYRFEVLVVAPRPMLVQQALAPRMEDLARQLPAEVIADVDPVNLL